MAGLKREIAQERPFSSKEEEAFLNLLRTSDCLERAFQRSTRHWGITSTQYNVLRILRGAPAQGLTCSAIGDRMITAEPDITRLLARMKALKLIRQQRDKRDKRVVWTAIAAPGLELLDKMDEEITRMPRTLLGHLSHEDLDQFIHLLEEARRHCQNSQAPVSCTGERCDVAEAASGSH